MKAARALALFALVAGVGCGDAMMAPAAPTDRAALFDDLWHQFDLHYSFFELKRIDWNAIGARYRPAALSAGTDAEFSTVLAAMLAELRDAHVAITPTGVAPTYRYRSRFETTPTYFDASLVYRHYVPASRTSPAGYVRYGMIDAAVGYIQVPSFAGTGWAGDLDVALKALDSARSLIVDIRGNGGGKHTMAAELAGRFADRARTVGYLRRRNGPAHSDFTADIDQTVEPTGAARFAGRVYLLTDRASFSTAEDFTLAMRALPTVTVVGDTTGGAAGGPIVRELANGWTYQLSEWIAYTAEHQPFEDVGLAPDVVVKATAADATLGIDRAIERALVLARTVP